MSNVSLGIAAAGLDAAQTAMDVVAQNLTNSNTPGYRSQTPDLVAVPGGDLLGTGYGSKVATITQAGDQLLTNSSLQASASLAQSTALQQVLSQAQLAFQDATTGGLTTDLSSFWQSWDAVASNPTDAAARQQVIDGAQNLVSDLQQAQSQVATTATNAGLQLSSTVSQANSLLANVAGLNSQIQAATAAGGSPNALIDQRNAEMQQLASAIGAVGTDRPDGTLQVTAAGVTLVQGNWYDQLSVQNASGTTSLVANTTKVAVSTTAGTTAGLMAALNSYLPSYQSQLDNVANSLANVVNGQLANGYTAAGTAGQPLFSGTGAAGISVNPAVLANPMTLAASSTSTLPAASNDGSNAQALANLYNMPNGPDVAYRTLVLNIGNQVSSVQNQVQAQTSVANAAQQNLQSVAGVNQNDQLTALINYQQAYQAAAKVITTVDQAVQSLIAAVA